ncbi:MAG: IPT/TIG domain-containing protein, partial [Deltaproteobacteria bacterium]|nr:IPT/TIG domain-containing protein [Deltaproteobacteria bacterium]
CLIIYEDSDGNDSFSGDDDTIRQVVKSQQGIIYEVTGDPWITTLIPASTPPTLPGNGQKVLINGMNFGDAQGDSILHIGGKSWSVGHPKIKIWKGHKIKFKVPAYEAPFPKYKDVWVTVNGQDSNKVQLEITVP